MAEFKKFLEWLIVAQSEEIKFPEAAINLNYVLSALEELEIGYKVPPTISMDGFSLEIRERLPPKVKLNISVSDDALQLMWFTWDAPVEHVHTLHSVFSNFTLIAEEQQQDPGLQLLKSSAEIRDKIIEELSSPPDLLNNQ